MDGEERLRACDICGAMFPLGPYKYRLRRVAAYDIWVCAQCHHRNATGWGREVEERVLKKVRERGREIPRRQRNGLLPFE